MISTDHLQNLILSLLLVLGCIVVLSWALRRLRNGPLASNGEFEVLGATYLGPKERVVLLKVRDKELLIGLGPNHMCSLGEFPSSDDDDA